MCFPWEDLVVASKSFKNMSAAKKVNHLLRKDDLFIQEYCVIIGTKTTIFLLRNYEFLNNKYCFPKKIQVLAALGDQFCHGCVRNQAAGSLCPEGPGRPWAQYNRCTGYSAYNIIVYSLNAIKQLQLDLFGGVVVCTSAFGTLILV